MAIRVVRLGTPREPGEGIRLGTVRRPPRGVRKEDYASADWYDVWLPEVAPSAELVRYATTEPLTERRWATFVRRYRSEMQQPLPSRLIALLAALSHGTNLSVGCYCEDPSRCHRSPLGELLREAGAAMRPM
jgi:uncharacterized protein YeaO (DUF488 family)